MMGQKASGAEEEVDDLVKTLWDYHHLNQTLKKADLIFCLGSNDVRVAERATELYLQGLAPKILFSGSIGRLTEEWTEAEADVFAKVAISMGVPSQDILIENTATNTGENISRGYALLKERGLNPQKIILVQKPYMERRAYATFMKQWPGEKVTIMATSPQIPLEEYALDATFREKFINAIVGDTERIELYAKKGFQIPQEMPSEVLAAYKKLIALGYNKQVVG